DAKKDLKRAKQNNSEGEGLETVDHQEASQSGLPGTKPTIPLGDEGAVPGGEEIGLYVLGLQEVVDVSSPAEALRPYTDPTHANKYKDAIHQALPEGYILIAEQQLIGLLLLIYASPSVHRDVRS